MVAASSVVFAPLLGDLKELAQRGQGHCSSACLMELKEDIVIGALNDAVRCKLPL